MWRGIPLADKSLAWFGLAIVLIVLAAMTVPWVRMGGLVAAGQLEQSRQLAAIWDRLDDAERAEGASSSAGSEGSGGAGGGRAGRAAGGRGSTRGSSPSG